MIQIICGYCNSLVNSFDPFSRKSITWLGHTNLQLLQYGMVLLLFSAEEPLATHSCERKFDNSLSECRNKHDFSHECSTRSEVFLASYLDKASK